MSIGYSMPADDVGYRSVMAVVETAQNKKKRDSSLKLKKRELNLIIVDDDKEDTLYLAELLEQAYGQDLDLEIDTSPSFLDAEEKLTSNKYDLAVLDFRLGYEDGLKLYERVKKYHPNMPVVFVTGQGNENTAVAALKSGAADYVVKDDLSLELIKQVFSKFIKIPGKTPLVQSMGKFISSTNKDRKLSQKVNSFIRFEPKRFFMKSQSFKHAGGDLRVFSYLNKLINGR